MSIPKLFIVLITACLPYWSFLVVVGACTVTLDGVDRTEEFVVTNNETGMSHVDCDGKKKCVSAVIVDCPVIECKQAEACFQAKILNFTESVICDGVHACHSTEIVVTAAAVETVDEEEPNKTTVSCSGSLACAIAHIEGPVGQVSCRGSKACRKTHVQGAKVVKCHDGKNNAQACMNLATFETDCVYCGIYGCWPRINQCRYKLLSENMEEYEICIPENVTGQCPESLEEELKLELSGQETNEEEEGFRKRL